jgi:hypothetical protein
MLLEELLPPPIAQLGDLLGGPDDVGEQDGRQRRSSSASSWPRETTNRSTSSMTASGVPTHGTGSSHIASMFVTHPITKTMSTGPSPAT